MTDAAPAKKPRPLSPHLQIYKPQLTSGLSIFHRGTGIALSIGLPVFVVWLVALANGEDSYATFIGYVHTLIGQLALFGFTFAFFFHFCMGLRHLIWDTGHALEIENVYRSGYIALAFAVLLTLGIWAGFMWCHK